MSKQITAAELAELVSKLLTDPQSLGELDSESVYGDFMTDIATAVCDHCGGEIHHPASPMDDTWYIGIHGNDSLPDGETVWDGFDLEGELFNPDTAEGLRRQHGEEHPQWPRSDWTYDVENGDTRLGYWDWVAHNVESAAADE